MVCEGVRREGGGAMSGRETCFWRMCWVAKGKWAVSTQCGHEFLLTRNMRLSDRMLQPSFSCPYCGREDWHDGENDTWNPLDEQLKEWGV